MATLDKISTLVQNQLPDFYKEEGPNFIAFMEAYYEYLEQNGKMTDAIRNLQSYRDINTTTDDFIQYFVNTFLPNIPLDVIADKKLLVKYIRLANISRGTLASYKLLFRALYNEELEVSYPADQILKVSDGDWRRERYLVSAYDNATYNFIGKTIKGSESQAEALVEDIVRKVINGRDIMQILLSNVKGTFNHLEPIRLLADGGATGHAPIVEAGINQIIILSPGADYRQGDVVELLSDLNGDFGKVVVTEVEDLGGVITFSITDGGSGYTASQGVDSGTIISIFGGDGLANASFVITPNDINNTFAIAINTDLLSSNNVYGAQAPTIPDGGGINRTMSTFANVMLSAPDYGFREDGEVLTNGIPYRTNENAVLRIANTAEIIVGDSLFGVTSSANATVTAIIDGTGGDAYFRVDSYKSFTGTETVKIGTSGGSSVGTVTSFSANAIGTHILSVGNTGGQTLVEGDEIVGVTSGAFGVIKLLRSTSDYSYEHVDVGSNLSGTISSSANTVTGIGTSFLSDFSRGDRIVSGGQAQRVFSVANNTQLTTAGQFSPALSGATYAYGGEYRTLLSLNVSANTSANLTAQFDSGPLIPFLENEGIRKVGSATVVANSATDSSNTEVEHAFTRLIDAFNFSATTFGTIVQLSLIDGGTGYSIAPTVSVKEPNIAALGIGEQYITLQWDDVNLGTGNSSIIVPDTNDRLEQIPATGDIKSGLGSSTVSRIQFANGTYQSIVRVWQPFNQRTPGNVFFANNASVSIKFFDSSYVYGETDTRSPVATGTAKIVGIQDEGVLGDNAVITPSVGANGTITGLRVIDSGFAYRDNEILLVEASDRSLAQNARVRIRMGGVANSEGYYATSRSHISTKRGYIQDSRFYQEFSYQVISPISLDRYREIALKLVHPAGQALFGKFRLQSNAELDVVATSIKQTRLMSNGTISIAKTAASGTIAITNNTARVTGTSTDFVTEFGNNTNTFIVEYDSNKFVEVGFTANTATNVVLDDKWIFGTVSSANIYYANTYLVTGTSTDFTAEFANGDIMIIETDRQQFVQARINKVISDTQANLSIAWTGEDLSGANAFYYNGDI